MKHPHLSLASGTAASALAASALALASALASSQAQAQTQAQAQAQAQQAQAPTQQASQTPPEPPAPASPEPAASAPPAPPPQPPAGGSGGDINQVVITADKREQRLQYVPISVNVVDGNQLTRQNIIEVPDLVRSAPSLNTAGPFGALSLRGIGSVSFSRSSEGSVGVVVDNVALGNTSTNAPQLFDVARVEVLNGPQGTLFGRNASAGVISIVTNAPDPTKFEAIAHVDVGEHHDQVARLALNIPLNSDTALRLSNSYSVEPEYQPNLFDDSAVRNRNVSSRARLLWAPNADLKVNLIADYTDIRRDGGAPWSVYADTAGSALAKALASCGVAVNGNNGDGCVDGGNASTTQGYGYSGEVNARLGSTRLTSITAVRGVHSDVSADDIDSSPKYLFNQSQPQKVHNLSEELRLAWGDGGMVDYLLGLYYFDSKFDGSTTQIGPLLSYLGTNALLGQTLTTHATTTSYAGFGQAKLHLRSDLEMSLSLRYGSEDVGAHTRGSLPPGAVASTQSIAPVDGAVRDDYLSYRAGLQYDLNDNQMAYASYTRGYKGPSVNDQGGGGTAPLLVRPEIPHASEVGLKNTLLGGRLGLNVALFYNRVDDFQAQFFDASSDQFVFGNAPSLTSKGVELNIIGRPLPSLTLNAGYSFTDATYGGGYLVTCGQGQTVAQGCKSLLNAAGTRIGGVSDAGGNTLAGLPKSKLTLSAEYLTPSFGRYRGSLQADVVYTSRINFDAAYDPLDTSAAATIVGGRIGVRSLDGRFGVSLFVRNLFDTYRPVIRFPTPVADRQLDPQSYAQISGPESRRVIGISLDARF